MKMKRSNIVRILMIAIVACMLVMSVACSDQKSETKPKAETSEQLDAQDFAADSDATAPEGDSDSEPEGEEEQAGQSGGATQASKILSNFVVLSQYPELPNGCEVTTLAAVLNYNGVSVDKTVLSDNYLPKAPVGSANFYREFVGNPRDSNAYGCYAPVIVTTAQSYLSSIGSGLTVSNLTGTPLDDLFGYIDRGIPVIVWATQYNQTGHYSVTWYVDGQSLTWFTPEHCVTLIGYDLNAGVVYVADPMTGGQASYDISSFRANYDSLGQQAIVIM